MTLFFSIFHIIRFMWKSTSVEEEGMGIPKLTTKQKTFVPKRITDGDSWQKKLEATSDIFRN